MMATLRLLLLAGGLVIGMPCLLVAAETEPAGAAAFHAAVWDDWEAQETRRGRTPESPEAVQAALERTRQLLDDAHATKPTADLSVETAQWEQLVRQSKAIAQLPLSQRLELYRRVRTLCRRLALSNPLVTNQPILFMERQREVGYMLYEYLGWYYAYGHDPQSGAQNAQFPTPKTGGGVFILEEPGVSMKTRELTEGLLPPGHFVTLALSCDARTVYFAFADPSGEDPYSLPGFQLATTAPEFKSNTFHLFAINADGRQFKQLTDGPYDDFDPCPLPDGGIAFESTRRGSKLRCGGGSPELVYTLHRMDSDGNNVRTLSFHETHEWHPSVLNDGRIVYTRWDYVDRNAAKFHGLWTCNPDGSNPSLLFGNYTTRPWACYQAKAIPDSNKILFVAGGHHANVGGRLMILDPTRVAFDSVTGEDRAEALRNLTPDVCFAEAEGWPKSYFYSPWPLSEKHFLVAFSHDPLHGGYTGEYRGSETGLYYFDCFGNLELLYRHEGVSAVYPIPLTPRAVPPVTAGAALEKEDVAQGEFLLHNVHSSLLSLPPDRQITQLRVFQLLPKSRSDRADDPSIGHPDQANARMLLGTVPVETDGSAYFRAPAEKPLYFQAVDTDGRAVQGMRSIVYLQRGERRGCVGCHEPPGTTAPARSVLAALRKPSDILPGPDGTKPFGYPRLVQPVLDRYCVACHDGASGPNKSPLVLTGELEGPFSRSYVNLKPYLRWPSPDAVTHPGQLGADASPLSTIVVNDTHRKYVELPDEQLRILYLWLDSHVPFYGTYEEEGLQAQQQGLAVSPPQMQ